MGLFDHWANIRGVRGGSDPGPLDVSGELDQITEVYRQVPSKRLVVLGAAGSGKTTLMLRFVLDRLDARTPADPVPVIFSLGSWNPAVMSLRDWICHQLVRDYPGLAAPGPNRMSMATALVDAGRILPVLDGFDEIAAGLHGAALHALNATSTALLLTSRRAEYAAAVTATDVLTAAAVIELTDLRLADVAAYLPRTTRPVPTRGGGYTTVWEPVLTYVRDQPNSVAAVNFTAVLSSPLMVVLARTVYSDTPGRDPTELLDTTRFTTPAAIRNHLLAVFVPAAYQRPPLDQSGTGRRRPRHWKPEHVQRWLGYLATHLNQLNTYDLVWWQLGNTIRPRARAVAGSAAFGLVMGAIIGLVTGLDALIYGAAAVDGLVVVLVLGLGAALVFGLVFAFVAAAEPSRTRVRIRGAAKLTTGRLAGGMLAGTVFGLMYGVAGGVWYLSTGANLPVDLAFIALMVFVPGVLLGAVGALLGGLVGGLVAVLTRPIDIKTAVSPSGLLAADRVTTLAQSSAAGLVFGLATGLVSGVVNEPVDGLSWGITIGLPVAAVVGLGMSAWGRWLILVRLWLPVTGRLPWAVMTFLDTAYRHGLFRQAGPVYQFRHAELQAHLAGSQTPGISAIVAQRLVGHPAPRYLGRTTNRMAIASLALSLTGLSTCGVSAILGAILGHVARRQIRERGQLGDGLAVAGIVVGWLLYAVMLVYWLAVVSLVIYFE